MKVDIFPTASQAGIHCAQSIAKLLESKPEALICLAAGHTSIPVFESLMELESRGRMDFSRMKLVGLDEWVGLSGQDDGSCENFLNLHLLNHISIPQENIRLFDGKASNPQRECEAIEEYIAENGGIDYLLLGMGMNGHLALNEPGVDFARGAHVSELDEVTKRVSNKYFKEASPVERGMTLGIKNIIEAKEIQLLVTGEAKAEIVARLLQEEISNSLPATALKPLDYAQLVLDASAAKNIPAEH